MKLLPFARAATPHSPHESEIKSPQRGNIAGNSPTMVCIWCRTRTWPRDPNFVELNKDYDWKSCRRAKTIESKQQEGSDVEGKECTPAGHVLPVREEENTSNQSFGGNRKTA